ncbi:MAG: tetratricopeptide repeat protein [Myxococcota bacterium]
MARSPIAFALACLWMGFTPPAWGADVDAETLLRQGRLLEALDVAAQNVADRPDDVVAQELAIDVFLSLGQTQRAIDHARERLKTAPTADSHYLVGRAEVDPTASRKAYQNALSLNPDHARAHMGLAGLDELSGDPTTAQTGYARATTLDPALTEAWVGLSRVHLAQGQRAKAQKVAFDGFERTKAPDLALMLATLDPRHAEAVLAEALTTHGSSLALHNALARTALLAGKAGLAEQQAQQALVLDVQAIDARAAFHWARELAARRITTSSLTSLLSPATAEHELRKAHDKAIKSSPKSAMARFSRALLRQAAGDAGYVDDLTAAAAIAPDNDLVAVATGDALLAAGRPSDAVPHLTRAVSARPWDRAATLSLARSLRRSGHTADAILVLERVASANPKHVESQLLYAQTLLDQGRAEEAYAVTKIAMVTKPDPRIIAAFIRIAPLAGRPAEAANVLEPIASRTNNAGLKAAVSRLRKLAQ